MILYQVKIIIGLVNTLQMVLIFLSPPQMVALFSWLPVWPTLLQPGSWSAPSLSREFERWRKRTGRSGCSSANRRAPPPSPLMGTMATSSGEPRRTRGQRTGTTQRRRRTTTQSVPDRPAFRSVRSDQETQQQLINMTVAVYIRNYQRLRIITETLTLYRYSTLTQWTQETIKFPVFSSFFSFYIVTTLVLN